MKINFYGNTQNAAEKKASIFAKTLQKTSDKLIGKQVNVTSINRIIFEDKNYVVNAYKFCSVIEYNISPK